MDLKKFGHSARRNATSSRALLGATGLAGSLGILMLALPNTALAQNECGALPGAGGLVSCPASGNPYPAGITYLPTAGLTVVLPADVSIQTATPATPGVQMVGAGDLAVDGSGASIATGGALSNGVTVSSLGGSADVGLESVSTTGAGSTAVSALTDTGAASVITTGNVTSTGRGGAGISAVSAMGDAFVTANNVSTVAALPADTATSRSAIFAQVPSTNPTAAAATPVSMRCNAAISPNCA